MGIAARAGEKLRGVRRCIFLAAPLLPLKRRRLGLSPSPSCLAFVHSVIPPNHLGEFPVLELAVYTLFLSVKIDCPTPPFQSEHQPPQHSEPTHHWALAVSLSRHHKQHITSSPSSIPRWVHTTVHAPAPTSSSCGGPN